MQTFKEHEPKFASIEEEVKYLREQVALKEFELTNPGKNEISHAERGGLIQNVLNLYTKKRSDEVLAEQYALKTHELDQIVLDLPPEAHDQTMAELLGVMQQKGIYNALQVVERLQNAHVTDDFHRFLIEYIRAGYPTQGLKEKTPLWNNLHMTLFEVAMPEIRDEETKAKSLKELVSVMEQFYAGLSSVDPKDTRSNVFALEVSVADVGEEIIFYVAIPTHRKGLFEKQLLSLYPHARLEEQRADYNIFIPEGFTAAAKATLKEKPIFPIKTYLDFDTDPFTVLLNAFSKIDKEGVGATLQVVINPHANQYLSQYKTVLEKIGKGKKLDDAYKESTSMLGSVWVGMSEAVRDVLLPTSPEQKEKTKTDNRTDEAKVESIRKKVETPIFGANIRIIVSARDTQRADDILRDIESAFSQFENTSGNRMLFNRVPANKILEFSRSYSFRAFSPNEEIPLSIRELSTLMHFPIAGIGGAHEFKQAKAGGGPAPIGLPNEGTLLGVNMYRGTETKAYITPMDRLRHFYVIGQTGVGKTVLLKNMIMQDIERGDGVCFIDPHGSDVQDVLAAIPESRFEDVIYFDPSYLDRVFGLNMLEFDPKFPEQKTFVVNELFSIFRKLYGAVPESMGPAFEQYFRNATMLVLEDQESGTTLLDVSRVLADSGYRALKLSKARNPVVKQFWEEIATKAQGEASLANIVPYITNKFDVFTANEYMRPIIAQEKSAFRFRDIMDNKNILLVNLSKGRLGDINANLIGLIIVGKILMAALSRVDAFGTSKEMPPFYLYIDEFQNITTDSISSILSEARKYKLGLTVAHQFIAQLQENIRDAVFGNVGSMAVFRISSEDAKFVEPQFAPTFSASDIMNLDNRNAYVKLLAEGKLMKPFNIQTLAPRQGNPEQIELLKQFSYLKYGRRREDVEEGIDKRYRKPQLPHHEIFGEE